MSSDNNNNNDGDSTVESIAQFTTLKPSVSVVPMDSTENSTAPDMNNYCRIDVGYLLRASDDELGLPPSPLLNSDAQPSSSLNESCASCLVFPQNAELKSFLCNWQFEDDFVDYTQFSKDAAATAWDIFIRIS
ncbi:hypothetical protein SUGI_0689450 [Cryptomeria japonica]|nr:hypothetical protein SUGI_0689450 [Cryptomeria japonica]